KKATEVVVDNNAYIDDITEVDIRKQLLVKNPKDAEAYLDMKARGINVKGKADDFTRKQISSLEEHAKTYRAKGLAWMKVGQEGV
ncbi:GAD domain-containing protein, partial [Clostridioides difficile]